MTHSETRAHWLKETGIGFGVGVLYGLTNVVVGHPFDTIKTKMQAQPGFENRGMLQTITTVFKKEGIIGLYRGSIPPLCGSGIYRSIQFAAFEGTYTFLSTPLGETEIPCTGGLQNRVIVGALISATCRAIIECPLEYAKIRRQTNQSWTFRRLYTGFGVTWLRTCGLMTAYFIQIDTIRRRHPEVFTFTVAGPFATSGIAATVAWWLVWPLEVVKSKTQSSYGSSMSTWQRLKLITKERVLYRGLLPGTIRSFLANGAAMVVMLWAQKKVSQMGLRD